MKNLIALTGATGQLGHHVVAKLKERVAPERIVGLVRTPAKADDLGVAVRAFDYDEPADFVRTLEGIGTLLLISSNVPGPARVEQHRRVIEAAREAGVERIVYTSLLHADRSPLSLAPDHLGTEAILRESGVPFTILRNGWYAENHTASIGGVLAGGAVLGSAGDGRISAATREDYAEAAAETLSGGGHENRTYELAGDDAFTMAEYAAEISRQTGRVIPYRDLPEAEYAAALAGFGLPEAVARSIAGWDVGIADGALVDDGHELSALIGRPTTPISAAISQALAATE